jgi:hypothetical protein
VVGRVRLPAAPRLRGPPVRARWREDLWKFAQVQKRKKRELVVSRFTLLGHLSPHAGKSGPFLLHGGQSTCKGASTPRVVCLEDFVSSLGGVRDGIQGVRGR